MPTVVAYWLYPEDKLTLVSLMTAGSLQLQVKPPQRDSCPPGELEKELYLFMDDFTVVPGSFRKIIPRLQKLAKGFLKDLYLKGSEFDFFEANVLEKGRNWAKNKKRNLNFSQVQENFKMLLVDIHGLPYRELEVGSYQLNFL